MKKQKILIIGGGGREHAIGWKVAQSKQKVELFFAPGNAGTAMLGTNINIGATDISKLIEFAKKKINLTLALPDDPLALGIVDSFQEQNLRIWGPTKAASELEWSKAYAKDFMGRHNIPTAKYKTFNNFEEAKIYVEKHSLPVVVKASGLALGKGVTVAQTHEKAMVTLKKIFIDKIFGAAGNEVVIEEFLSGTEISIHALSDGKNWKIFPPSQDHKRIYNGDMGPNTGGMGTIAPLPFVDSTLIKKIEKEIIAPTIQDMAKEGRPFVGCLYPGIMLTIEGSKVFEFNSRFGDPETQTYMRLLETDILDMFDACIDGTLDKIKIEWKNLSACTIVLASEGYPGNYEKGKVISGIEDAEKNTDVVIFHAGTKTENGKLITNGGRVLGVSAIGKNLEEALATAYNAVSKIKFDGMQYRKDIGKKALKYLVT
ncbi:phosphoribosylamine--glycine ligase [Candidatus Nomurabacteria bacterium RIFCSPLOWO2_01_FULL_39_17]|uniref:Phosphoribosylamine--glycine ligase n=1 Tax=Candidatus Nomurabacteria bacterium RIFCSPLOWO2_01_FULL_39_17 TaxID=1801770 RepID=A0A1F6WV75_9BACT|nr:MAG: phosphoribosylamine--glycine ligase [Candidatus Nomurabacteria bacterium RIFCSPLOWO2_01_FULL_39_17]